MAFTESAISRALVVQTKRLPDRVVGHTNGLLEVLVNNELGKLEDFVVGAPTITFTMIDTETGITKVDEQPATGTDQGELQYQLLAADADTDGLFSCQWTVNRGANDVFRTRRILQRFIRQLT